MTQVSPEYGNGQIDFQAFQDEHKEIQAYYREMIAAKNPDAARAAADRFFIQSVGTKKGQSPMSWHTQILYTPCQPEQEPYKQYVLQLIEGAADRYMTKYVEQVAGPREKIDPGFKNMFIYFEWVKALRITEQEREERAVLQRKEEEMMVARRNNHIRAQELAEEAVNYYGISPEALGMPHMEEVLSRAKAVRAGIQFDLQHAVSSENSNGHSDRHNGRIVELTPLEYHSLDLKRLDEDMVMRLVKKTLPSLPQGNAGEFLEAIVRPARYSYARKNESLVDKQVLEENPAVSADSLLGRFQSSVEHIMKKRHRNQRVNDSNLSVVNDLALFDAALQTVPSEVQEYIDQTIQVILDKAKPRDVEETSQLLEKLVSVVGETPDEMRRRVDEFSTVKTMEGFLQFAGITLEGSEEEKKLKIKKIADTMMEKIGYDQKYRKRFKNVDRAFIRFLQKTVYMEAIEFAGELYTEELKTKSNSVIFESSN